jgi:starch phosphorylase
MYGRIKQGLPPAGPPRTVVFGGKAAPGYRMAKLIIRLINGVADVINRDPEVAGHFRVAFVPDFNVTNAQRIYPAADLSEQISTAGKEASGTGNMKFAMNGAVTIGTLDGANVEIRDAVGHDNFFLFGLTADEVAAWKLRGYSPRVLADGDAELKHALDLIRSGLFAGGDSSLFRPLVDSLLTHDEYMVLADFRAYVDCQARVGEAFLETARWTRMSILNSARVGRFSSDRSISEYCRDIWNVRPVEIEP